MFGIRVKTKETQCNLSSAARFYKRMPLDADIVDIFVDRNASARVCNVKYCLRNFKPLDINSGIDTTGE